MDYTPQQTAAINYALQNLFTPSLQLNISASGGTDNDQVFFEVPFLVRQMENVYFPSLIMPTQTLDATVGTTSTKTNQVLPSREEYTWTMQTQMNNFTYIGANNPADIEVLNGKQLWWLIPVSTYIRVAVSHTAQLTTAVDTFPVAFNFQWLGYRLTNEIVSDPANIAAIINCLGNK